MHARQMTSNAVDEESFFTRLKGQYVRARATAGEDLSFLSLEDAGQAPSECQEAAAAQKLAKVWRD